MIMCLIMIMRTYGKIVMHDAFYLPLKYSCRRVNNSEYEHFLCSEKDFRKRLLILNVKSMPYSFSRQSICCAQIINTETFISQ